MKNGEKMPIIDPEEPDFFSKQVNSAKRFYTLHNPQDAEQDIILLSGGRESCVPGYRISRKTFPYFSMEFVASGSGELNLEGRAFALTPGVVFTYGPRIQHTITNLGMSPLVKYFVNFTGLGAKNLLERLNIFPIVMHTSAPESILGTFEELTEYGFHQSPYGKEIRLRLLEVLLLKFAESSVNGKDRESPAYATYRRCRQTINGNYLELNTLEELADRCNTDASYLCRLFGRFDHQSPYKYLMRLKMNYAADLLLNSGRPIKEVAGIMRYEDPYHFSRAFRNYMGISPRDFRKRNHKD